MKGRNGDLIKLRNEALIRRYYYWTETQRLRFDDTIRILSRQEFFISEERVMAVIRFMVRQHPVVKPVPRIMKPKISAVQLELFTEKR